MAKISKQLALSVIVGLICTGFAYAQKSPRRPPPRELEKRLERLGVKGPEFEYPTERAIIYERTNPRTGERYIGSSLERRYQERQKEHDRELEVKHDYKVLARVRVHARRISEEYWIRKNQGIENLENKRYEMSDSNFHSAGGIRTKKGGMNPSAARSNGRNSRGNSTGRNSSGNSGGKNSNGSSSGRR